MRYRDFITESPRVKGADPNPKATDTEKEFASQDVSQRKAVERTAKKMGIKGPYGQKVSAITQGRTPEYETERPTLQDAERFRYATAPGGRAASDELKAQKAALAKEKGVKPAALSDEDEEELISKAVAAEKPAGLRTRMRRAGRVAGALGQLTGDKEETRALSDVAARGDAADAPAPIDLPDNKQVKRAPMFRHLMQPNKKSEPIVPDDLGLPTQDAEAGKVYTSDEDGLNYHWDGNKYRRETDEDEAATLAALTADDRVAPRLTKDDKGEVAVKVAQVGKPQGENPQVPEPSAEELKTFDRDMAQDALAKGEISQERFDRSMALIDAFEPGKENPEAVQDLSFTEYVGEVGKPHPAIEEYKATADIPLGMTGIGASRGLDDKRKKAGAYGGNLGPAADKYRIPGAPDGVYDLATMEKENKKLYRAAIQNREDELIRTYLRQNGRNAYSWFEGQRSIVDMNLEHIMSLSGGGFDHPDNWVWAGEELNKMKNEYNIADRAKTYGDDKRSIVSSGKNFAGWRNQAARAIGKNAKELEAAIVDAVPAIKMRQDEYSKMSDEDIDAARKELMRVSKEQGMPISKKEAEEFLPKPKLERAGARRDPIKYDRTRRAKEQKRQAQEKASVELKNSLGLKNRNQVNAHPVGRRVMNSIEDWGKPTPRTMAPSNERGI